MFKVSRFYTESRGTFFVNSQLFESFFLREYSTAHASSRHMFDLITSSGCTCFKGYHFYRYPDYHKRVALNPKGLLVISF